MIKVLQWLGIYPLIQGVMGSLDNKDDGFSARKLTAFTLCICTVHLVWKYSQKGDFANLPTVLIILQVATAFFLALITTEQLMKAYNISKGNKDEPS